MAKTEERTRYLTITNQVRITAYESLENVPVEALKGRKSRREHERAISALEFEDEAEKLRLNLNRRVRLANRLASAVEGSTAIRDSAQEIEELQDELDGWNKETTVLALSLATLEAIQTYLDKAPYNGRVNHLLATFDGALEDARKAEGDAECFVNPNQKHEEVAVTEAP